MSKRAPRELTRPEIRALKGYHLATPDCRVKLNQNEAPLAPEFALKSIALNRYPKPLCSELQNALAKHLGWSAEGIVLANGSNVLVQALVMATALGQTVLTVKPTFGVYALQAKILAKKLVEVALAKDFSLPLENFLSQVAAEQPSIIFLPNPNAPTGNLFEQTALESIAREACDSLLVIDEAYYPFSDATFLPRLKDFPNVVVLRTFSKSMALAGVRLGYAVGAPEIMREVEKVLLPFRISALAEALGLQALGDSQSEKKRISEILKERQRVFEFLRGLKGVTAYPSQANFILFSVQNPKAIFERLCKAGVLIRDVTDHPGLEQCLRVSIGTPSENDAFMKGMKQALLWIKCSEK